MFEQQYLPHQPKSLSGIAVRSLILGISFTASLHLTLYIRFCTNSAAWRAPLFVTTLSAFHFLEFWTTATYNTSTAETQSFLFTSNGHAYYIAHTLAIAECLLRTVLFPNPHVLPAHIFHLLTFLGLVLIITMQAVRSLAMITAGQSFNHVVQHRKARTHALITTGIYSHLRHPSYFGYFWWGLGTQLMLGNAVCFIGYALVLWKFFAARIPGEEAHLARFFGDEYGQYRKRTWIGIPFIR
ncbi:isoprenylcysteine carboxyl methyltransferase [Bisporella sp. PMI_857]|nr:isoprenylcysteine carboxyl methyltransferase [Bisporella sp. PMI_857]